MRGGPLWLLSALALAAQAEASELGARYWYSESATTRSHNAQTLVPFLGNPTSVLAYDELVSHAVELYGRKKISVTGWFIRGNVGLGSIERGSFDDEDFLVGQVKFSDSTSQVKGNKVAYATLDMGRELWPQRKASVGLFVGYHHWVERLDAYGAVFTVGSGMIPESEPVITNEVTWRALRFGFTATSDLDGSTRLNLDAAAIPYARVRDEDSHWLRQDPADLGPAPNILMEGRGYGVQLDVELRHRIGGGPWHAGAGVRHWWLRSRNGSRVAAGTNVPLTELVSQRTGVTLTMARRW